MFFLQEKSVPTEISELRKTDQTENSAPVSSRAPRRSRSGSGARLTALHPAAPDIGPSAPLSMIASNLLPSRQGFPPSKDLGEHGQRQIQCRPTVCRLPLPSLPAVLEQASKNSGGMTASEDPDPDPGSRAGRTNLSFKITPPSPRLPPGPAAPRLINTTPTRKKPEE